MQNIWMDAIENLLAKKWEEIFKHDLSLMLSYLHVTCHLSEVLIQVDKEYNYSSNYPKGNVDEFHD
jgi:hypothetical protein